VTDLAHQPGPMVNPDARPMLLTVKDVEAELQLGRTRTYELVRSGELPVVRIGRAVRIPRDALRRWVEAQVSAPGTPPDVSLESRFSLQR